MTTAVALAGEVLLSREMHEAQARESPRVVVEQAHEAMRDCEAPLAQLKRSAVNWAHGVEQEGEAPAREIIVARAEVLGARLTRDEGASASVISRVMSDESSAPRAIRTKKTVSERVWSRGKATYRRSRGGGS